MGIFWGSGWRRWSWRQDVVRSRCLLLMLLLVVATVMFQLWQVGGEVVCDVLGVT